MVQASDSPLPPRAHAPLRREFQRITETVERWHLTEHSREIRLLCEAISSGAQHHFDVQTLGHLVEQFETFHKEIPFVTAPESALAMPGITVGRQVANNSPIT